jgi:hypothetical protein
VSCDEGSSGGGGGSGGAGEGGGGGGGGGAAAVAVAAATRAVRAYCNALQELGAARVREGLDFAPLRALRFMVLVEGEGAGGGSAALGKACRGLYRALRSRGAAPMAAMTAAPSSARPTPPRRAYA